jgi:hypothetical protein
MVGREREARNLFGIQGRLASATESLVHYCYQRVCLSESRDLYHVITAKPSGASFSGRFAFQLFLNMMNMLGSQRNGNLLFLHCISLVQRRSLRHTVSTSLLTLKEVQLQVPSETCIGLNFPHTYPAPPYHNYEQAI